MSDLESRVAKLSPEQRALLALRLAKKQAGSSSRDDSPLVKQPTFEPPPLSSIQESLLYLHYLVPENAAYNAERVIRIKGPLNVSALEGSLGELLRRHEVLRTTCSVENGRLVQKIHLAEDLRLSIIDLQDVPEPEREKEILRLAQEQARRPFDLSAELMFRVTLVKLTEHDHVLILIMHDFVTDGYSDAIMARELGALYQAFSKGQPSPLTDLPIQYADYSRWERQRLQGAMLADQLAYWTRQLSGVPALLELPTDHPRPRAVTFRGAREYFELGTSLSAELRAISGQMGVTLFMTLLAAYQLLLDYYSRQDEIVVAALVSNRNCPELEGLIGSFANTVAVRSSFSRDVTFRELVETVGATALEAFSNQDLPFDQLVKELHPKRDPSYNPIFQTTFEFHQDTLVDSLNLPGLTLSSVVVDKGTARLDLDMSMINAKDGLIGALEYNTDLFNVETIKRLLGHFQRLLKGIVANPDAKISEFSWVTDSERHVLLEDWNRTAMDFPQDVCVQGLVEAQAERTLEAVAVQSERARLSYGELARRANQLAHYLVGYGIGPGVLVGVCLERSVEMVVALLGILKAGGAYVPLDPEYPKDRLGFMLEDAGVEVVLTQRGLLNRLPKHSGRVVCLDRDWEAIGVCSAEQPVSLTTPEDLAYVIYTSGSTGRPKGVQVPHRAVVNFLMSMRREPGLSAQDVLVAVTTLSFDIAVLELFLPLCVGGRVVIASREVATDGMQLAKLLMSSGATVMQATPATWRLLVEAGWHGGKGFKVLCGGEALDLNLAQELLARVGRVWNLYGPTETTVWSTCYELKGPEGPVLIGRPIGNTRVYLLDRHRQPVPVGVPGELYISGVGVSRGYWRRPELTEGRFVPDPFGGEGRLYKTGDLARYRADGNIEYLGRLDHQVKVRGFRIEPGEVEVVLLEHPAVAQTAAVVREDRPGDIRLVAYFALKAQRVVTVTELRKHVRTQLPEYMVPQHFVELEGFPLTPNGKVDRRALPSPFGMEILPEERYVAPRTEMETRLAAIWQEVLGIERVGMQDNFFELGGHSLLAIKLVVRMERATGVRPQLRSLVLDTLEQIASTCERGALGAKHEPVQSSPPSQESWKRLVGKVLGF